MITLGSQSKDKLNILKDYFKVVGITNVNIIQVRAESNVSDQPLLKSETILGAKNRAKNAFVATKTTDLSIGLEGGLSKRNGLYHLICVASIYDGNNFYTGISQPIPLPASVSKSIEKGHEFGVVIREYSKNKKVNSKDNVQELISRHNSFKSAIEEAFSKITDKNIVI